MQRVVVALLLAAFLAASCGGGSGDGKPDKPPKKRSGQKSDKQEKAEKSASPEPPPPKIDVEKVAEALSSEKPLERDAAIDEMSTAGAAATQKMLELVASEDQLARTAALAVLSRTKDKAAKKEVEKALEDAETAEELLYALLALGGVGDSSSIPKMRELLTYEAPARFPPEADWMVEKGRETEEAYVQNQAAESMARLGDCSGVSTIIENLGSNNGWIRKDSLVRLRRMTGCKVDFGYYMGDSRDNRAAAVAKWKNWWKEKSASFKPDWTDDFAIYDVDKRGK